jgi:hypothetical protein
LSISLFSPAKICGRYSSAVPIIELFSDKEYMVEIREKLECVSSFV